MICQLMAKVFATKQYWLRKKCLHRIPALGGNSPAEVSKQTFYRYYKDKYELAKIPIIPCTTCNYCAKVCPQEIGISGSFIAMNYLTLYGDKAAAKHQENWLVGRHGRKPAADCIKCGKCEQVCPQHIAIREELERVFEGFG